MTVAPIKRPEVGSSLNAYLLAALCHHIFMALQRVLLSHENIYSKTGVYRGIHYFSYFCSKT